MLIRGRFKTDKIMVMCQTQHIIAWELRFVWVLDGEGLDEGGAYADILP